MSSHPTPPSAERRLEPRLPCQGEVRAFAGAQEATLHLCNVSSGGAAFALDLRASPGGPEPLRRRIRLEGDGRSFPSAPVHADVVRVQRDELGEVAMIGVSFASPPPDLGALVRTVAQRALRGTQKLDAPEVLLVNDSHVRATLLRSRLELLGFRVRIARTPLDAVHAIVRGGPFVAAVVAGPPGSATCAELMELLAEDRPETRRILARRSDQLDLGRAGSGLRCGLPAIFDAETLREILSRAEVPSA